jgi:hypothetical protein
MIELLSTNIQEHWRAVEGCPGYYVSDLGNVRRSALYDDDGREVYPAKPVAQCLSGSPRTHPTRYMEVSLRLGSKSRRLYKVHQLVAKAFLSPRPPGLVCCHGLGGQLDNRAVNLRWDTQASNIEDMHRARGGNHNALKTECKYGHDLTNPENLYPNPHKTGIGRKCKTCAIRNSKAQHAQRRAAKGAQVGPHNGVKVECKYGHDLTDPDNVYQHGGGRKGRKCRACAIRNARAQTVRKRENKKRSEEASPPEQLTSDALALLALQEPC